MKKNYEYKTETSTGFMPVSLLNELGKEGWELTTVLDCDMYKMWYFKREIK